MFIRAIRAVLILVTHPGGRDAGPLALAQEIACPAGRGCTTDFICIIQTVSGSIAPPCCRDTISVSTAKISTATVLATDWRQVGTERQQQQQRTRRRRGWALHLRDGPGPRRSFSRRWARVALSSGSNFAGVRSSSSAPPLAPRGRKPAPTPEASRFLPAPVPTLQTVHKAL